MWSTFYHNNDYYTWCTKGPLILKLWLNKIGIIFGNTFRQDGIQAPSKAFSACCHCPFILHFLTTSIAPLLLSKATTSISTLISSSPSRQTPTQVHTGWWSGIYFLKFFTMASRASSLSGTWYELTLKTWDHPFPPASFKFSSTFANAWSICVLISLWMTPVSGSQPPREHQGLHHYTHRRLWWWGMVWSHTLTSAFYTISYANRLTVPESPLLCFAMFLIGVVLERRHGIVGEKSGSMSQHE